TSRATPRAAVATAAIEPGWAAGRAGRASCHERQPMAVYRQRGPDARRSGGDALAFQALPAFQVLSAFQVLPAFQPLPPQRAAPSGVPAGSGSATTLVVAATSRPSAP